MQSAPCVFFGDHIIAVCYVDDLLGFSETRENLNLLKKKLMADLILKDVRLLSSFLGIERIWKKNAFYLIQKRLKGELLGDNNMAEWKAMSTPMNSSTELRGNDNNTLDEKGASTYRIIIGSLLYSAIETRPEFCVAASTLGSYVERPCDHDMAAAKLVLRYLKGTLKRRMKLEPGNESQLRVCWFKLGICV